MPRPNDASDDFDPHARRRAMEALPQQEDIEAIQAGIDDMEAGRMTAAEEAHRHGREQLISRYPQ